MLLRRVRKTRGKEREPKGETTEIGGRVVLFDKIIKYLRTKLFLGQINEQLKTIDTLQLPILQFPEASTMS